MRSVAISLLFLLAVAAQGQEAAQTPEWIRFGIAASPDLCYRTLKAGDEAPWTSPIVQDRDEQEIPRTGFTVGATATAELPGPWGVETGLQYAEQGYRTRPIPLMTLDGVTDPLVPREVEYTYRFRYLGVPLLATYHTAGPRVQFRAVLGFVAEWLLEIETIYYKHFNDRVERHTAKGSRGYTPFNLSPSIGFGVRYVSSSRFSLTFTPTVRYGLLKIYDAPISGHLYSGGIVVGCQYAIQRQSHSTQR